jgi:dTDP-4-amino-4,6-dideoxygalactose transaminase
MSVSEFNLLEDLAILGAAPAFLTSMPVGQLDFPDWDDYEETFRSIFERQYYTNQGPLVNLLEERLAARLQVRHAICVTNATIGLSMVAEALAVGPRVIIPAFTFIATAQSLLWGGRMPIFCDVDLQSHHLDVVHLERLLKEGADAILAVNLWGGACNVEEIEVLSRKYGVPLYFDSAQAFGSTVGGRPIGGFGEAEVFSFHATKMMSTTEGGCITTNQDDLAERLRNIRSSYGVREVVNVDRTANGRMSEAQAAIGLLSLDVADSRITRNRALHDAYKVQLGALPGIKILDPQNVDSSNYQYFICEIDEQEFGLSRDELHLALHAENIVARRYFTPGIHRIPPFSAMLSSSDEVVPMTDMLCSRVLQLPLGARLGQVDVNLVCEKIRRIQQLNKAVKLRLTQQ